MSDWEYDLDEVGPDAEPDHDAVEPGTPTTENVAFFVLGVGLAIYILLTLV
jgi:hypothetical protein